MPQSQLPGNHPCIKTTETHLVHLLIIEVPFEQIAIDRIGPLVKSARRHQCILADLDYATRYPEAVPLKKSFSKAIARGLFHRFPKDILMDQGTLCMSRLMGDLSKSFKNGKNWDMLLPALLFAIWEVPQTFTGFSSFELVYGRRSRGILDLLRDVGK